MGIFIDNTHASSIERARKLLARHPLLRCLGETSVKRVRLVDDIVRSVNRMRLRKLGRYTMGYVTYMLPVYVTEHITFSAIGVQED